MTTRRVLRYARIRQVMRADLRIIGGAIEALLFALNIYIAALIWSLTS